MGEDQLNPAQEQLRRLITIEGGKGLALLRGSLAIDGGPNSTDITDIDVDQRGTTRPKGRRTDIGAFERE